MTAYRYIGNDNYLSLRTGCVYMVELCTIDMSGGLAAEIPYFDSDFTWTFVYDNWFKFCKEWKEVRA